jgi:hypothetical protein
MKKTVLCMLAAVVLLSTTGCANGPVRRFLCGRLCNTCQPPVEPTFGFGHADSDWADDQGHCVNCVDGGVTSVEGDPYVHGSYYNGATINPPVFDSYSSPSYGGTIVPPGSSGILPNPNGQ